MTIKYAGSGDIFSSHAQTLVCPVNTKGVMGAGLAKAFSNKCPGLLQAYKKACAEGALTIDSLFLFKPEGGGQWVLCLPTKEHWSEFSSIKQIETILKTLSEQYEDLGITSLAITPIGCGLGRLDYIMQVKPLMYLYLDPIDIDVSIVMPKINPSQRQFD